jgi:aspartate-semialdehyde dehydrogenase
VGFGRAPLLDAKDCQALKTCDIILTCQGTDYTKSLHPQLRALGWDGYWIDAASHLRHESDAVIAAIPTNTAVVERAIEAGIRDFIGGNCTVTLMLMAIGDLVRKPGIEWIIASTYQAMSGAGARQLRELLEQIEFLGNGLSRADRSVSITELEANARKLARSTSICTENIGAFMGLSLLPWIDSAMPTGQTREEWKGDAETNKILGLPEPITVDGTCVRVPSTRCHAQALTLKLKRPLPIKEVEAIIEGSHEWVRLVANTKESSYEELTPMAVANTLNIHVGRVRHLKIGEDVISLFTVGDQLLWGAAEPLRCVLRMLTAKEKEREKS